MTSNMFISTEHKERYFSLLDRKIIEERAFNLHPDQYHDIHVILKQNKLTYLNSQIQSVAKEMVLEFYASAYTSPYKDTVAEPELVSCVRAEQI